MSISIGKSPRLAVRGILIHQDRLLLVNAWANHKSSLWCAPGGGVECGQSLPNNLEREVKEETGLTVQVGTPCLVNEFHDPKSQFHQVEVFFRCRLISGHLDSEWIDPQGVVSKRQWFTREETEMANIKPSSLPKIAWAGDFGYDPLELIVF
ncbi:MAG: NUDIX hydrolase [Aestuariivita sp.]|nr:NUDIX hydrolase [Aestuariivita sp.]MCY4202750.1 NUDIX hydrolase [Aestuariivita sp.]MCY4288685.1 NUDIX hydrolase [Aestuariivita sp.]MCY4348021.1 NUDIX hydrolase [Aestuariivita sp.]